MNQEWTTGMSMVIDEAISLAISAITEENALDWFNHCGLFFESIR
jgi:hypothetical protein